MPYQNAIFAAYPMALKVTYLERRKRTPRCYHLAYKPSLVIAAGYNNPELASMFGDPIEDCGLLVTRSRYASCHDGWRRDFDRDVMLRCEILANYLNHNAYAVEFAA